VRFNVDIAIVSKRDIDPGPFQTIATNLAVFLERAASYHSRRAERRCPGMGEDLRWVENPGLYAAPSNLLLPQDSTG